MSADSSAVRSAVIAPEDVVGILEAPPLALHGRGLEPLRPPPKDLVAHTAELSTRPRLLRDPLSMTGGKERAARLRELRERSRLEPGSREESECAGVYESFGPLNREVLRVCTDWQVRPGGAPHDHADAAHGRAG